MKPYGERNPLKCRVDGHGSECLICKPSFRRTKKKDRKSHKVKERNRIKKDIKNEGLA